MSRNQNEGLEGFIRAETPGDDAAVATLFSIAYEEVHALAHVLRRGEASETLNTTGLVHEAYFKLLPSSGLPVESLAHFKHIVGRAMRQVLVDKARARGAQKRGGDDAVLVTLTDVPGDARTIDPVLLVELHEALDDLEEAAPRSAKVVECRFFAGLDVQETAMALDISPATVKRDWKVARAWLAQALDQV